MKRILMTLILTGAALAQTPMTDSPRTPQTIKVRMGFDRKHKPVYMTTDVRIGYIVMSSKRQGPSQFIYSHGTIPEVHSPFVAYTICGAESFYSAMDAAAGAVAWEAHQDVSYAVLGRKLYLISPAALQAGIVDTAPLDMLGEPLPPMDCDALKAANAKP